ncbi:MAG: hypothetical protein ACRDF4_06940, partial [Rhabdochlamydiaceae bacterium]
AEELFIRLQPLLEQDGWTMLMQARFLAERSPVDAQILLKRAVKTGSYQLSFYAEATQALRWIEDDSLCQPILEGGLRLLRTPDDLDTYVQMLSDMVSFYDLDHFEERLKAGVKLSQIDLKNLAQEIVQRIA